MATKLIILPLFLSLLFISQASSDSKKNEETAQLSQALHLQWEPARGRQFEVVNSWEVFGRGGERRLMHNLVIDISKYFKDRLIPRSLALAPAPAPSPGHLNCSGLCEHRCSLHSRQNTCLRACGTCCARCKCVPPGTFGNREMCGKCYTGMTTHGNKPKCP